MVNIFDAKNQHVSIVIVTMLKNVGEINDVSKLSLLKLYLKREEVRVFNCLNTITVCQIHVQQEAREKDVAYYKRCKHDAQKAIGYPVHYRICAVVVKHFHTVVKYMYSMTVFSSNDFNNSYFFFERMSRTHTNLYQKHL